MAPSWLRASALAFFLAGGCRATALHAPVVDASADTREAKIPDADTADTIIRSGRASLFSEVPADRLSDLCGTSLRPRADFCAIRIFDTHPDSTHIHYLFRNAADLNAFEGSEAGRRRTITRLVENDMAMRLASQNGRAAVEILGRRPGETGAARHAAANAFLTELKSTLSMASLAVEDRVLLSEEELRVSVLNPGLANAILRYAREVEENPAAVLNALQGAADPHEALAFLDWLSSLSDLHPFPRFEEHLRHMPRKSLNARTSAALFASEFWHLLLERNHHISASLWTPEVSSVFGQLNTDGSQDTRFLTLLRLLLPRRGYSQEQIRRILASQTPAEILERRSPDLAALVRDVARHDPESIPIGYVNMTPGGGLLTNVRRMGTSFVRP